MQGLDLAMTAQKRRVCMAFLRPCWLSNRASYCFLVNGISPPPVIQGC